MKRPAHLLIMALGIAWSQLLLVFAWWLVFAHAMHEARLIPALGLLAAGLFVAMWLVVDVVVSDAGSRFVASAKTIAVSVFYVTSGLTVYGVITGRATMLFFPL